MAYVLYKKRDDLFEVLHSNSGVLVGYADRFSTQHPYQVCAIGCVDGDEMVAMVDMPEAIVPALEAFYRDNPPEWQREGPAKYTKFTDFGVLPRGADRRVGRVDGIS